MVGSSDFDGDVHAGGQIELLQFVHGLRGGIEDVNQPLVGALFESFLRLLVAVRRALDREAFDAGGQRDGTGDARARALDGVGSFAGRLVYDPKVISLEADSNTLSHTKSNCLLMVVNFPPPNFAKAGWQNSSQRLSCNTFLGKFWLRAARGAQMALNQGRRP